MALSAQRVGSGLRSSWSGLQVTVFGSRGRLGSYVAHELGRMGTTLMLPHHGDELEMRHLKVMGDYGQIGIVPFSGRDRDSIRAAVEGSDVVINCIGKHYETRHAVPGIINWSFEQVNSGLAECIAQVCEEKGVERLIHVSAAAANHESPSEWARSKASGEARVCSAFPNATVVRPTITCAPEDNFLTFYARMAKVMPFVPLIDLGDMEYQPVYIQDVAKAITEITIESKTFGENDGEGTFRSAGQTYELAGPSTYTQKEIVEFVFDNISVSGNTVPVPAKLLEMQAWAVGQLPRPFVNSDTVKLWSQDDIADGSLPGFEQLGITPANLEDFGPRLLLRFRPGGHFLDAEGYH